MTDYISRKAAKEKHCAICKDSHICYRNEKTCPEVCAFDTIPAADLREVKRGKWIKVAALAPFEQDDFRCSECDSWPWWCGVTDANLPNFCPNCGADMREGKMKGYDDDV